jgi:hypothetical protein
MNAEILEKVKAALSTERAEKVKLELSPEDFDAWQWAAIKLADERCRCNREVPYRESQGEGEWVDEMEAIYKADGLEMPAMYVSWNPRCLVHGFPPESEEYRKSTLADGLERKWYQRWRDLMERERVGLAGAQVA